jgi:uncharacterized membrane protein YphA (DoxX/SURF4 family)
LSLLRSRRLHLALRVVLGGAFLFASLDKIASPPAFARIVYQWQITGPVPSNLVAVALPWIEALAGVLLLAGLWRRESALVLSCLLAIFIGAAATVMARGIDVTNCGCTSVARTEQGSVLPDWTRGVGWFLVTRNALMLAGALVLVLVPPQGSGGRVGRQDEGPAAPAPRG